MGDLITALVIVAIGIGGLIAVLGGLYWLTRLLPTRWSERSKIVIFVFPAADR